MPSNRADLTLIRKSTVLGHGIMKTAHWIGLYLSFIACSWEAVKYGNSVSQPPGVFAIHLIGLRTSLG